MSHTSTRWSTIWANGTASRSSCVPGSPMNMSHESRTAMAVSSPTASFTCSIVSRQKRARFSSEPPYSSVRLL